MVDATWYPGLHLGPYRFQGGAYGHVALGCLLRPVVTVHHVALAKDFCFCLGHGNNKRLTG